MLDADAIKIFENSEVLLIFIKDEIKRIALDGQHDHQTSVQEALILLIAHRLLKRDPDYSCGQLVSDSGFTIIKLQEIKVNKPAVGPLVDLIFGQIQCNSHYKDNIERLTQLGGSHARDLENSIKKYMNISHMIWRSKP